MAALLAALMIASLLLTTALPLWTTVVKREREAELIWRGTQYARAIDLFRRKCLATVGART
jgi:type II secretory pathway pseudopilin PulG